MNAVDSSVLIAAMFDAEIHHSACSRLLDQGAYFYAHGMAEVFSTITGGRLSLRVSPQQASELLETDFLPCLQLTTLAPTETLRAIRECHARGVQGGAVYDYLHLSAARKAKAKRLYTINASHFRASHRSGDPEIVHP